MTRHVRTILQAIVAANEPVSPKDIHYAVKRFDPLISRSTVRRVLNELIQCGLAVSPERYRQPTRYLVAQTSQPQTCSHPHLVCKDCGAMISSKIESQVRKPPDGVTMAVATALAGKVP
jgi:Fe2+ or Zn2+ uptake regulation protein